MRLPLASVCGAVVLLAAQGLLGIVLSCGGADAASQVVSAPVATLVAPVPSPSAAATQDAIASDAGGEAMADGVGSASSPPPAPLPPPSVPLGRGAMSGDKLRIHYVGTLLQRQEGRQLARPQPAVRVRARQGAGDSRMGSGAGRHEGGRATEAGRSTEPGLWRAGSPRHPCELDARVRRGASEHHAAGCRFAVTVRCEPCQTRRARGGGAMYRDSCNRRPSPLQDAHAPDGRWPHRGPRTENAEPASWANSASSLCCAGRI